MAEQAANEGTPTPQQISKRLGTLRGVRREMARVYADARCRHLDPADATKFAYVLTAIQKALEAETLEARIAKLEQAAEGAR